MSSDQPWPSEWLRGVLGACVLRVLAGGPTYGYAIASRLADSGLGLADPSPDGPVTSPLGAGPRPSGDAPGPRRMLIASIQSPAAAVALVTLALLATIWSLT